MPLYRKKYSTKLREEKEKQLRQLRQEQAEKKEIQKIKPIEQPNEIKQEEKSKILEKTPSQPEPRLPPKLDLFYSCFNRLTFVQISLSSLIRNTDWDLVTLFYVVDDGSTDGTSEYIKKAIQKVDVPHILIQKLKKEKPNLDLVSHEFNNFLAMSRSPYISRVDSDVVVFEGWVEEFIKVLEAFPQLGFLGSQYGMPNYTSKMVVQKNTKFLTAFFSDGNGVFRKAVFKKCGPTKPTRYFMADYQINAKNRFGVKSGWLATREQFLILDRLKIPELMELSKKYVEKGWSHKQDLTRHSTKDDILRKTGLDLENLLCFPNFPNASR